MKHISKISLTPTNYGEGETTVLEQLILLAFAVFFSDWRNFSSVMENLQKFYAKT